MADSPFPRLSVFAQHAQSMRENPVTPPAAPAVATPFVAAQPTEPVMAGGPAVQEHPVDSPVEAPIAAAVVHEAVRVAEQPSVAQYVDRLELQQETSRQQEAVRQEAARAEAARRPSYDFVGAVELDDAAGEYDDEGLPVADVEALRARDVAREMFKARLIAIAERRERRSAWEIAFIMLAGAVAMLLTAPLFVQILLAMHGVEA